MTQGWHRGWHRGVAQGDGSLCYLWNTEPSPVSALFLEHRTVPCVCPVSVEHRTVPCASLWLRPVSGTQNRPLFLFKYDAVLVDRDWMLLTIPERKMKLMKNR